MTEVVFHTGVPDRLRHACKVARKALRSESHLVITGDEEVLERMDQMLWGMGPHSFVAHCRADAPAPMLEASCIVLALPGQAVAQHAALLNLGDGIPADFGRYAKVIEVVPAQGDAQVQQARQRWRQYRELGHAPVKIELSEKGPE